MTEKKKYPGLNDEEVLRRLVLGEVNRAIPSTTRKLSQIILDNSVTLFNLINLIMAGFIIYTGSFKNLLFLGVIVTNTIIGIYQELKAKRNIDSLKILHQAKVEVIRNYQTQTINQDEVVKDDLILIKRGQQIIVDGIIVETEGIECDESQITGESNPIEKQNEDEVYSGSFVISGQGIMQAVGVGEKSYSYQLTMAAKQDADIYSELVQMMKKIIRLLSFVIIPVGAVLMITSLLNGTQIDEAILGSTAATLGMIPEGLVLLTSVALAVGVIKLSKQNVLVQTMGSIETLARVDILCLDKTGTLTSGKLKVIEYEEFTTIVNNMTFEVLVSRLVSDLNEDNATGQALMTHFIKDDTSLITTGQIPFSSARKWSAVSYQDVGSFYMGAPEFLFNSYTTPQQKKMSDAMSHGLRIISVAHSASSGLTTTLPSDLTLVGFIFLEDEIRVEAPQTLDYFRKQSVDVCIISGDHPETVSQIARRVGVADAEQKIDMSQVHDSKIPELVKDNRIFGRVSPEQKKLLVEALQADGHVVGMTGDGVNDILALKKSDCSIVMSNGSDAAKGIADFVLLDSNFDSMVNVVLEGRKVINNIQRVASLYLTKTIYSMILAAIFIFLSTSYPFQPIQLSPINSLTVGIPSFFLALRPNTAPIKGKFLKNVFEPTLASGCSVAIMALLIEVFGRMNGWNYAERSTITVWLTGVVCFTALMYIAQPMTWKIRTMIAVLIMLFLMVFIFGQTLFSLVSLINVKLMILYIPLTICAYPLFYLLKGLFHKLLGKLN
ncbi:HAD-IC family P-type ATPase [Vagococcus vulneris]|uniref:Magnesium-transporting ATPase n=1 Tax=Vagococcus vulneris TaxID=1977869 RepID=A0A430A171_9ENTE|nr:HAD-IC family P-type ATPase [Vagococcus vulneris]RSU00122.1 magnesium-transporting ATPase [Vagococcus vulneris]